MSAEYPTTTTPWKRTCSRDLGTLGMVVISKVGVHLSGAKNRNGIRDYSGLQPLIPIEAFVGVHRWVLCTTQAFRCSDNVQIEVMLRLERDVSGQEI